MYSRPLEREAFLATPLPEQALNPHPHHEPGISLTCPPTPAPSQPCPPGATANFALGQESETSFFLLLSGSFVARWQQWGPGLEVPSKITYKVPASWPLSSHSADHPLPSLNQIRQFWSSTMIEGGEPLGNSTCVELRTHLG